MNRNTVLARKRLLLLILPVLAAAQPFTSDTVGGTILDWPCHGSSRRWIAYDSLYGIHAAWLYSNQSGYEDRTMRYNFYDLRTGAWLFDSAGSYMTHGVSAFDSGAGYGALDVNPVTHAPYIAGTGYNNSVVSRSAGPGSAEFEESAGHMAFCFPDLSLTPDQKVHVTTLDASTQQEIFYMRVDPWGTWSTPLNFSDSDPNYDTHYIEAAKLSANKVAAAWVDIDTLPMQFYYRISSNSGQTWSPQITLPTPPAFSSTPDTIPSFHYNGNCLTWDNADRLHIAAVVIPIVDGRRKLVPAEIWHYCADNTPDWTRVAWAGCDSSHLLGSLGSNATCAGRPMLAVDELGALFCAWEQFDSSNVEPVTGVLRADIFASASSDNGATWSAPVKVTTTDQTSHRWPSLARNAHDGNIEILYLQDLQAGSSVHGQGSSTLNPLVHVSGPIALTGVAGPEPRSLRMPELVIAPSLFQQSTAIRFSAGREARATLRIYDAAGNVVRELSGPRTGSDRQSVVWDGRNDRGLKLAPGVYFVKLETELGALIRKTTIIR